MKTAFTTKKRSYEYLGNPTDDKFKFNTNTFNLVFSIMRLLLHSLDLCHLIFRKFHILHVKFYKDVFFPVNAKTVNNMNVL